LALYSSCRNERLLPEHLNMATTTRPESPAHAPIRPDSGETPVTGASEAPAAPPKKKRNLMLPILGVLVVLGAIWGVKTFLYSRSHESTDDAQVDGHIVPVLAKVSGYVDQLNTDDNWHIKEGTLAVLIDTSEYKARLEQSQGELAAAMAAIGLRGHGGQAYAQVQTAEGQSAATDAQIVAAQANYDKAVADLARYKELADKQIVSKLQLDAAQAAADAARADLLAAQKQAAAAGASVSGAQAGVTLAQARVLSAQATLENARLQLGYTHVTAPASGLVSRKQVEPGQLVQAGQTLFSIVTDTGTYVTANYKETQLNDIRVGQHVLFGVDAYSNCTAEGIVESLAGATGAKFALLPPDNATGNFTKVVQRVPVRIKITKGCGDGRPLRPGMSVDTHIETR
jgi:membrane fusion protein (multidrug efflux system)